MSVVETLKAARALIEKEENWCRGAFSRGKAFCAAGAIMEVCGNLDALAVNALESQYVYKIEGCISKYNDTHTHAEVLALFDKAIKHLEASA